jgi:hypothetical protein
MRIAAEAIAISIALRKAEGRKAMWMYGTATITTFQQYPFQLFLKVKQEQPARIPME